MSKNVVFLGVTESFPFAYSANNSKNELLAKTLINNGCEVSIINGLRGYAMKEEKYNYQEKEAIKIYNFKRGSAFQVIRNCAHTYRILKELRNSKESNYLLIGYHYFPVFIFYVLCATLLNYKKIVIISEWHSFFENESLFRRINYFLFERYFGYCVDGIFPISELIISKIERFQRPFLKIPILADFNSIIPKQYLKSSSENEYFLYCADISYLNVIKFTIDSFEHFHLRNKNYNLHLIVNGTASEISGIQEIIDRKGLQDNILLKTKLPFRKLIEEYQEALALLIPLRTTQQDAARFPHKIGEYIATGRPIITGNVGEINYYFFGKENAYIADEFTIAAYARLMENVVCNKSLAHVIGERGRKLGEQSFHYSIYGTRISNFLSAL